MRPNLAKADRETGSATVEAVVLVPMLVVFVVLSVAFGRYETTREEVIGAARAAAEAASIVPSPGMANSAAEAAAAESLSGPNPSCIRVVVSTNTMRFVPGGVVKVTVSCTVELSSLGAPGLPGQSTVSISQVAPIDPYRVVS